MNIKHEFEPLKYDADRCWKCGRDEDAHPMVEWQRELLGINHEPQFKVTMFVRTPAGDQIEYNFVTEGSWKFEKGFFVFESHDFGGANVQIHYIPENNVFSFSTILEK